MTPDLPSTTPKTRPNKNTLEQALVAVTEVFLRRTTARGEPCLHYHGARAGYERAEHWIAAWNHRNRNRRDAAAVADGKGRWKTSAQGGILFVVGGGKGFPPLKVQVADSASRTLQEGSVSSVVQLWSDGPLLWNPTAQLADAELRPLLVVSLGLFVRNSLKVDTVNMTRPMRDLKQGRTVWLPETDLRRLARAAVWSRQLDRRTYIPVGGYDVIPFHERVAERDPREVVEILQRVQNGPSREPSPPRPAFSFKIVDESVDPRHRMRSRPRIRSAQ